MREHTQIDIFVNNRHFTELNPVILGFEDCVSEHSFGPAVREYYLIHCVVWGHGYFENERGKHKVRKGQSFLIRPSEITYYQASKTDPWSYIWVGFTGRLAEFFDTVDDVIDVDLTKYFEAMRVCAEYGSMCEEYLAGQILLMMSDLSRLEAEAPLRGKAFAQRASNYIERSYMQPISVERLADNMNIDRRYLSRLFKRDFGLTVQEYIIKVRMEHAMDFLSHGYTVAQSASLCGYSDVFNFSKMFKKYFGKSPSEIKQQKKSEIYGDIIKFQDRRTVNDKKISQLL